MSKPDRKPKSRTSSTIRAASITTIAAAIVAVSACAAKIPNVRPFAAETAALYQASGTETDAILRRYGDTIDLADEVLAQSDLRLPAESRQIIESMKSRLGTDRQEFIDASDGFDTVLQQAVAYSERIAELAAAGESGPEAAQSLSNTINEFGSLVGAGGLITGPITSVLEQIADYHTRMQARKSLSEAVAVAQEPVREVGELLQTIYQGQIQRLVSALASDYDVLLLYEAGPSMTGYFREATERRDMFYRRALLTLRLNDDGISGFCRHPDTGELDLDCINLREMEALGEVEERVEALRPQYEAYQERRTSLRDWRARRHTNGTASRYNVSASWRSPSL